MLSIVFLFKFCSVEHYCIYKTFCRICFITIQKITLFPNVWLFYFELQWICGMFRDENSVGIKHGGPYDLMPAKCFSFRIIPAHFEKISTVYAVTCSVYYRGKWHLIEILGSKHLKATDRPY